MNIHEVIQNIRNEHCGNCRVGKAIAALYSIPSEIAKEAMEPVAITKPKPRRGGRPKRLKSAPSKPAPPAGKSKTCNACRESKPLAEFGKNKRFKDGHTGDCKACISKKARGYYAKRRGKPEDPPDPELSNDDPDDPDDDEGFACRLCSAKCSSEGRLESHMRTVHGKAM